MSYDLYFTSPRISRDQFRSYFGEHPRYESSESQAWYSNEDTGVYFSFEYNDAPAEDEGDIDHSVMFNMNFYRPHVFALEAEPEVSRFVRRFGCSIHDPQNAGMEDGPYSPEGFLKGWLAGNEFAYSTFLGSDDAPEVVHARPTGELENVWRWNLNKESRAEATQKDIFIPGIMYMLVDRELCSTCVWPDGIPTLIPRVDRLFIPRAELAPRSFFRGTREDTCILPFDEALPLLQQYANDGYELEAFERPNPDTPRGIKDFVRGLTPFKGEVAGVPMDQVLNRELVAKHRES